MKKYYLIFVILGAICAGAIGYETVSSKQPLKDEQTVSDLRAISSAVESYVSKNRTLPDTLDALNLNSEIKSRASKYEYKKNGSTGYQLCADFKTEVKNKYTRYDYGDSYTDPGYHKKGRQCFDYTPYSLDPYKYDDYSSRSLLSVNKKATDTERKTDITAISTQLEFYYAQNGNYPTLVNLNDATWRTSNMKGLDKEALKDPSGSAYLLVARASSKSYAYTVAPADCNNSDNDCTGYTLTATLEDGTTYSKESLN